MATYTFLILLFPLITVSLLFAAVASRHYKPRKHDVYRSGGRILGGDYAGGHPFSSVSIQSDWDPPNGEYHHFCTGNILTSRVILTACHCVTESRLPAQGALLDIPSRRMRVVAGVSDLNSQSPFRQEVFIQSMELHPQCGYPWIYDTAAIILQSDLVFTEAVRPARIFSIYENVALAESYRLVNARTECYFQGWGTNFSTPEDIIGLAGFQDHLKFSTPRLVDVQECAPLHREVCRGLNDDNCGVQDWHWMCAKSETSIVCHGDSGTGLFCNGFLWGVSSIVQEPCMINRKSGFTDIVPVLYFVNKYPQGFQFPQPQDQFNQDQQFPPNNPQFPQYGGVADFEYQYQ